MQVVELEGDSSALLSFVLYFLVFALEAQRLRRWDR